METTEDGYYLKIWLELYMQTDGSPTVEQKNLQRQIDEELAEIMTQQKDESGPVREDSISK